MAFSWIFLEVCTEGPFLPATDGLFVLTCRRRAGLLIRTIVIPQFFSSTNHLWYLNSEKLSTYLTHARVVCVFFVLLPLPWRQSVRTKMLVDFSDNAFQNNLFMLLACLGGAFRKKSTLTLEELKSLNRFQVYA
jgi:hypothetical protein